MSIEKYEDLLPTHEELLEQGIEDPEYDIEQKAEKEAAGLEESNIVGE